MAHHAGFAGTISVRESLAQKILHIYYGSGEFDAALVDDEGVKLTAIKNPVTKENLPDRYMMYNLFMAEPLLDFADRDDNRLSAHIRLNGTLVFTSASLPTLECKVQIDFDVAGLVETFDTDSSLQFGLNLSTALVENFICSRYSGPDPKPIYLFDLDVNLQAMITLAIWAMDTSMWRFTPPGFDELRSLDLVTAPFVTVRSFGEVATLGVDVTGLTTGLGSGLINMLDTSLEKGYTSTYTESIHTGDDDFGHPEYETGWTNTKKRPNGSHICNLSISINNVVLTQLYNGVFRQMIFDEFEQEKQEAIDKAHAKAEKDGTEYKEPQIAKTDLEELDVSLGNNYLDVSGTASYTGIEVTFSMKFRFVRTSVDGSTSFVCSHQDFQGMRAEVYDVKVDVPWWITVIQVLLGSIGIALAPFTYLFSALFAMMFVVILGSIVGSFLSSAGSKMKFKIAKQLSKENGKINFKLPDTESPELTLEPDDVVVSIQGADFWFWIYDHFSTGAQLKLKKYPGFSAWPVKDRNSIIVKLKMPAGYYHPDDTAVKIRWQVFAGSTAHKIFESDQTIVPTGVYKLLSNRKQVEIDHASAALDAYESFIIRCRVYRPWGVATQEIWSGEMKVTITDRLHRDKPYVRWDRVVYFMNYSAKVGEPGRTALGWAEERRKLAIHKTDPDERCRFADMYTPKLSKDDLDYIDTLPYAESEYKQHAHELCAYCFFGGPHRSGQSLQSEKKPVETHPPKNIIRKKFKKKI